MCHKDFASCHAFFTDIAFFAKSVYLLQVIENSQERNISKFAARVGRFLTLLSGNTLGQTFLA
jgi:hypothetical protein